MSVQVRRAAVSAAVPFIGVTGALILAGAVVVVVLIVAIAVATLALTGRPPNITWGSFTLRWPSDRNRERRQ